MKILYLSDNPAIPSGYGKIGKNLLTGLRVKGHQIVILGGSFNPGPFKAHPWNGMILYPVRSYANINEIRFVLKEHKPDVMIINSDPRHLKHVFEIDNEIRGICPLIFYHLWDDNPFPKFNTMFYRSVDTIAAGSKFAYDLLTSNYKDTPTFYTPMGIDTKVFNLLPQDQIHNFKMNIFKKQPLLVDSAKFIVGYVGRNIMRKRLLDLHRIFSKFAEGKDDVLLFLHTSPFDPEGSNLLYLKNTLYPNAPIAISEPKGQDDTFLTHLYNMFDVSINIAYAEGFGLPLAESMACGTPCISADTVGPGGLITKDNSWLIESKVISQFGSRVVPYIDQRFVDDVSILTALEEAYSNKELLKEKASKCRQYIVDNYSAETMVESFEKVLKETVVNWEKYPKYTVTTI